MIIQVSYKQETANMQWGLTDFLVLSVLLSKGCALESPFFVTSSRMIMTDTKSACEERHGRLITIDTPSKLEHVMEVDRQLYNNTISSNRHFIGLFTDSMDCSNYTWISGAPLTWNNWDLGHNQPRWCDRKLCVMMLEGVFRTSECSQKRLGLCEFINASSDINTTTGSITSELTATLIPVTSSVRQISTPVPTSAWAADAVSVTMTTTQLTTNVSPQGSVRNTTDLPCTGRKANETRLSPEELMNVIKALKAELSVMKNSTSTFRRRRISVYESRPSSVVMGGVACGFMSVVICWIVVPDVIIMCAFLCKCLKTLVNAQVYHDGGQIDPNV